MRRDKGGSELWEVEGTHSSLGKNPPTTMSCRVVSVRDNPTWRRPRVRPQNSWLRQVDASCWELLGIGREPAWRLVRCDCQEWRRRVGEATHPQAYGPHD